MSTPGELGSVRIDVVAIARGAGEMLDLAAALREMGPLLAGLGGPARAFGDSSAAASLAGAQERAAGYLAAALDRAGQVLEADADRLYQVAFATQSGDEAARRRIGAAGP